MTRRHKSHGCGRRMALNGPDEALAEAVERRTRAYNFGRLDGDFQWWGDGTQNRRWLAPRCESIVLREAWDGIGLGIGPFTEAIPCGAPAWYPEDVGLIDGVPVAMCAECRAHHASPPPSDSSGGDGLP